MKPTFASYKPEQIKFNDSIRQVFMNLKRLTRKDIRRPTPAAALISCALLTLSACAGGALPNDPFEGEGGPLSMVPVNHTDRYAVNIFIDKYWAGDASWHADGGGAACCYPGLKDWSQPVTVRWAWSQESDPQTKVILKKHEEHEVIAHFPAGGPHSDPDMSRDDAYVCVVLRDLDSVDLAFSPSRSGCASK